ncbi:MAG TPA: hypothetical protein VGO18_20690, partial [Steroidobacteraceae bacterium]|nr:hypothetical protein [Steroidobacteraceae bacterium]
MHARVAHVYAELTGSDLRVRSLVDSDPDVEICFAFPPTMAPSASEGLAIAASLGILVGSVSYAHSIALHFAVPDNELRLLRRLCGLLYDVRAALEHFDFVEPQISALPGHRSSPSFS